MATNENRTGMKLELVQVLFRHGERTPLEMEYEMFRDMFKAADQSLYEPYGLGQLTNNGKTQAYDLGRMLRERYAELLSARYAPDEVHARTSDTDRTKASLQLVLAGLYPPTPELTWRRGLNWLPIPFACVPARLDVLLNVMSNRKYFAIFVKAIESAEYRGIFSKFFNLVRITTPETVASDDSSRSNLVKMMFSVGCFSIHNCMNLPLPTDFTVEAERELVECTERLFDAMSSTLQQRKYNAGILLRTFLENAELSDGGAASKKLYLYSGHDVNIAAMTRALKIKDLELPGFASALILEKYRDPCDARVYVKLLYWSTIEQSMTTLRLEGCEEFCGIDDFERIARDVIPSDEEVDDLFSDVDARTSRELSWPRGRTTRSNWLND